MEENINYINTNEALLIIQDTGITVSLPTLIKWTEDYQIGNKLGGRWRIDKKKLIEMLKKGNPDGSKKTA